MKRKFTPKMAGSVMPSRQEMPAGTAREKSVPDVLISEKRSMARRSVHVEPSSPEEP